MSTGANLRGWHTWWSVALALPIVIVSLTAIFIAHEDALGLKAVPLPASWRLGTAEPPLARAPDVRAAHRHVDDTQFVATKYGLLAQNGITLVPVPALAGAEVRGLVSVADTLYVATKKGVWALQPNGWQRVLAGDIWSVSGGAGRTVVAAVKDRGIVVSADGGASWQPDPALQQALAAHATEAGPQRMTLHKLVMDMHTGKAFFGKEYEWLWIDIVSATMLFLTFSGLIMWWRARRRRLQMSEAQQSNPGAALAPVR